ncbi:hypothetical protein DSO57_1015497 [Entomophthora muscae]|uniref:Uncharacterized protein n=1 Tax=Entomophthora muscae TaxID=34485 RepID=A0ACC2UEI7_9FUNG|nr:hypothetical protein DSO57_1015497 [Entomophthora muscae]
MLRIQQSIRPVNNLLSRFRLFSTTVSRFQEEAAPRPTSSVPHGQVLKGINYLKTQTDPIAKADEEYPEWLWTLLEPKEAPTDILSRAYQRKKNKDSIKAKNFLKKR